MEAGSDFWVTRRRAGATVVVVAVGEIDLVTVDLVEEALDRARAEAQQVVLDLREVTFIDSAGIRLVVEAARGPGEFAVVRGPGVVQRLFGLVGLDGRVTVLDAPPDE